MTEAGSITRRSSESSASRRAATSASTVGGMASSLDAVVAFGPLGSRLEQLVPGRGEQQDRGPVHGVEQVVEQLEERRRRNVDVIDDRDQRATACDRLEQLA